MSNYYDYDFDCNVAVIESTAAATAGNKRFDTGPEGAELEGQLFLVVPRIQAQAHSALVQFCPRAAIREKNALDIVIVSTEAAIHRRDRNIDNFRARSSFHLVS